MHPRTLLILLVALLPGCTHYYAKSGSTDEEGARAVAYCQSHAPPIGQPFIDNCMRSMGWARTQ